MTLPKQVKKLIDDAIRLNGVDGVKTVVFPDGRVSTNHIPFVRHFSCCGRPWTKEMGDYVKSLTEGK